MLSGYHLLRHTNFAIWESAIFASAVIVRFCKDFTKANPRDFMQLGIPEERNEKVRSEIKKEKANLK